VQGLVGSIVALSVVLWALAHQVSRANWAFLLRRSPKRDQTRTYRNGWQAYVRRAHSYATWMDTSLSVPQLFVQVAGGALVISAALSLLHFFIGFSAIAGVVSSLIFWDAHRRRQVQRRQANLIMAFLYEAMPIGSHTLNAKGDLLDAARRMQTAVSYRPLCVRLHRLTALLQAPQFASQPEAFVFWAQDLGLREIETVALATREAARYGVALPALWMQLTTLLGRDLEFERNQLAETQALRSGAKVFYGVMVVFLLLLYGGGRAYFVDGVLPVFWMVLLVMTGGLWIILREAKHIRV